MTNKTYIFFARTINNAGGAQLYMNTKAAYLAELGYDVQIVFHQPGLPLISGLQHYKNCCILEMDKPAYLYSGLMKRKIINTLVNKTNTSGDVIVESHCPALSSWAELFAKQVHAKHIIYNLDEVNQMPKPMISYYQFKYLRHELVGIQPNSVSDFLSSGGLNPTLGSPRLNANGAGDCVQDVENYDTSFIGIGYNIGLIGRLEKRYMNDSALELLKFIKTHPEVRFNIIYVGGETSGDILKRKIQQNFVSVNNVTLFFTGFLFPIPIKLVNKFNVCISSAGATGAATRLGISTITVDPRDNMSCGIYSINTSSTTFQSGEKKSISFWLEGVYNEPEKYKPQQMSVIHDFTPHMRFIEDSETTVNYDTSYLNSKLTRKLLLKKIVLSIFPLVLLIKLQKKFNIYDK